MPVDRPAQAADLQRRAGGTGVFGFGTTCRCLAAFAFAAVARRRRASAAACSRSGLRRGGAQLRQQLLQRLRVFAERAFAARAVLVASVELRRPGWRDRVRAASSEASCWRCVRRAASSAVRRCDDLLFERVEFGQLRGELADARGAIALRDSGGRRACAALRRRGPARATAFSGASPPTVYAARSSMAQFVALARRGVALSVSRRCCRSASAAWFRARVRVRCRCTRGRRCRPVRRHARSLLRCIAALAFELAAFGGDVLQFAADALQAAARPRGCSARSTVPRRQRQQRSATSASATSLQAGREQAAAGHLGRLRQAEQVEHGRRDVAQRAAARSDSPRAPT